MSCVCYPILGFSQPEGLSFIACLDRSSLSDVLGELANGYDRVESRFVVHDGVGIALFVTLHCSFTYNPTDAWVVLEIDPGGPLASPRWRFCGFGRGLGSNEKVEMTLSALGLTGRGPLGAHLHFLP